MKSGWVDRDAETIIAQGAKSGIDRDFALRIYTTRLLGRDPKLVLHGGGNTSLKQVMPDRLGEEAEVLRIKATGADMAVGRRRRNAGGSARAVAQAAPAHRYRRRRTGRHRARSLIDPAAANPSVEVMLHAFLPHKFIDHTHATAVLSVIDQPDGERKCAEVFAGRLAFVPYVMPGFGLAKKAIEVFERAGPVEGLILGKHGIVTFGTTAREAYERMIEMVSLAETFIAQRRKSAATAASAPRKHAELAAVAPIVRGACSEKDKTIEGAWRRLVVEFRATDAVLAFVNGRDLARLSQAGVVTPDHTIRTKNWPLVLPAAEPGKLADFSRAVHDGVAHFAERYHRYFQQHNARAGGIKRQLDPLPRVVMVPGLGLFGLGRTSAMPKLPPISPKPGSMAWAMPRQSAISKRFRKPKCSIANIGRSNRRSSAPARSCRSRARLPWSLARPVPSAWRPPGHLRQRAPRWHCST